MGQTALTPALLDAAFVSFDTIFQQALKDTATRFQEIASEIPSSTAETRHAWLDRIPEVREWLGERTVNNLVARVQAIPNKLFEDTIRVKRTDIEDDQIGVYAPQFTELARSTKLWPDKIIVDALKAGTSAKVYDGQNYFDASHPINPEDSASTTQSNNFTGTALSAPNVAAVKAAMMGYKTRDGVPMEIEPDLLVVPPALEFTARQILFGSLIAQNTVLTGPTYGAAAPTNVLQGSMRLLVLPRLAGVDTTWYVMATNRGIKPMIFQRRTAAEFTFLNRPTDANVFMHDEYLFGTRMRGAAGYGPWFLAARAIA